MDAYDIYKSIKHVARSFHADESENTDCVKLLDSIHLSEFLDEKFPELSYNISSGRDDLSVVVNITHGNVKLSISLFRPTGHDTISVGINEVLIISS